MKILLGLLAMVLIGVLAACSSVPVKITCQEIQARIDYGGLTGDQLRFAMEELEDCKENLRRAEYHDSTLIDTTEKKFTPNPE